MNYETFFALKHIQKSLQGRVIRYEKKFKPRKRKGNIDWSGDGEPEEPKEKKSVDDSIKRGARTGLNAETIPDRMKLMQKYPPKGDWRRFDKQKIGYTELIQI